MLRGWRVTEGTVNHGMGPMLPGEEIRRKALFSDDLKVSGGGSRGEGRLDL